MLLYLEPAVIVEFRLKAGHCRGFVQPTILRERLAADLLKIS
jgi:hypothetical protein